MSHLGANLIFVSSPVADNGRLIWKVFSKESQTMHLVERAAHISLSSLKGRHSRCATVRFLSLHTHPFQCMSAPACITWLLHPVLVTAEHRKECVQPVRNGKCIGNKKLNVSNVWVMDCLSPAGDKDTYSNAFWSRCSHDTVINQISAVHHVLCLWCWTLFWS